MFLYVLFATGTCVATAAGFYYIYDKKSAEKIFYSATWGAISLCARLEDFYEKNIKNKIYHVKKPIVKMDEDMSADATIIETKNIKINEKITLHNIETDAYETVIDIPAENNYDWGFVKKKIDGKNKCKIYENINERVVPEEFVVVEKPFLQIELEQNGKKMEIHEHLDYFFLKDNKILDKQFLKWYMNYFFEITLEDNYKLHIIDHSINMLVLEPGQYVLLGDKDYDIKN